VALLVTAAAMSWLAPGARAVDQAVNVEDNRFTFARVAVKPGETVTWTTSGGGTHNVAFEDGLLVYPSPPRQGPWSTMRTFVDPGTYRYFCQIHGGLGMTGVVDVNALGNLAPTARFSATPISVKPGQTVGFDGGQSLDLDGSIAKYEWDLDGDGSYETDTGSRPATSRLYSSAAAIPVKLRVTDNLGTTGEVTNSLVVNTPPTASFTASPNPAVVGSAVMFNASGAVDPDGTISTYEWDLNGNGSYETNTGPTPTTSRAYADAEPVTVKLRVTDNLGGTADTTRSLQVNPRPPMTTPTPIGTLPAAKAKAPATPSFAGSRRSVRVGRSGRFSYTFRAERGLSGTLALRSVSRVNVGTKRRISLGRKSFTVPSSGRVKLAYRLSSKHRRTLRRARRIEFRAVVRLRNGKGETSSGAAAVTLKRPA
jgi:plastocyanin